MRLSQCRAVGLAVVMSVTAVACGGNNDAADRPESPNAADAVPQNEFWVELPAAAGEVREYYKGHLRREGLEDVYGVMQITQHGASSSWRYEFTEYKTNFGVGITAKRTVGNLASEPLTGTFGETAAYRLDGEGIPGGGKVFVKTSDHLYLPKDPAVLSAGFGEYSAALELGAKATPGRVEISGQYGLPVPCVRLRSGDVLVARVRPGETVKAEGSDAPLRQEGSATPAGTDRAFTFKVIAAGATELFAESLTPDKQLVKGRLARVKVDVPSTGCSPV